MIKVLYVHTDLGLGGAQAVRYMFLKHLDKKNFAINICCLGAKGDFGKKIEELGYLVKALDEPYGLLHFSTAFKLYYYIKENKFDIVHSSLFYANYHSALAASWAKVPFLVIEEHGEHNLHRKKRHLLLRYIGRQVAKTSNLVFCCSDFVKDGVQRMYKVPEEKIVVLKNLIEDKRLEIRRPKDELRAELNIPDGAKVIGTISSMYWVKNQKILIDLISRQPKNSVYLVMVGDGPLKNELIEYTHRCGMSDRVRFTGQRKDVPDMLNAFDIFVLPSISEGLPICLLEAMSIGLPCIASRAGGVQEVLKDEETGMLVEPDSIEDLSRALRQIIDNRELGLKLGSAARNYVMDYFQPALYVNKVVDLYSQLTNKSDKEKV